MKLVKYRADITIVTATLIVAVLAFMGLRVFDETLFIGIIPALLVPTIPLLVLTGLLWVDWGSVSKRVKKKKVRSYLGNVSVKETSKYAFLALLVLIVVSSLTFEFLVERSWHTFLVEQQLVLSVLAILAGFLTFYFNREVIDEVESERSVEEKAEKKRHKEFDKKYPFFTHFDLQYNVKREWKKKEYLNAVLRALVSPFIWVARIPYIFSRWVYKEKVVYVIIFILILLNAFLIRYDNLDGIPFQVDEYQVLQTSKGYYETGEYYQWDFHRDAPLVYLSQITPDDESIPEYTRSKPYTWITYFYVKHVSNGEFNEKTVRTPVLIIGMLFIILFYFVLRYLTIPKSISLITMYLVSIFPLFIWHSRYARMYGLVLLLFFLTLFLFFILLKRIQVSKSSLVDDLKNSWWLIGILAITFYVGYKIHINYSLVLIPIGITLLLKASDKKISSIVYIGILVALGTVIADLFMNFIPYHHMSFFERQNMQYLNYALSFVSHSSYVSYFLLLTPLAYLIKKEYRHQTLFAYLTTITILIFFIFIADRYWAARYAIFLWPFFISLLVFGTYLISRLFMNKKYWILMIILLLLITPFNFTLHKVDNEQFMNGVLFSTPVSHE